MERNFGKTWCCTLLGATQMFQLRSDLSGREGDPFGTQVLQVVAGPSLCKASPSLPFEGEQRAKHTLRQLGASTRLFPAGVRNEPHIKSSGAGFRRALLHLPQKWFRASPARFDYGGALDAATANVSPPSLHLAVPHNSTPQQILGFTVRTGFALECRELRGGTG